MTRIPLTGLPEIDRLLLQSVVQLHALHPWVRRGIERARRRWRREVNQACRSARRRAASLHRKVDAVLDQVCTVD
jgi:hypothetical protein